MKETFKSFQRVLVRCGDACEWTCNLFSHKKGDEYVCMDASYPCCIPYEGNEALVGTTDKPQPKRWRAKEGGHYWYIDFDGTATEIFESFDYFDEQRYSIGNYFRTFEEAEEMAKKFKEMLKEE